MLRGERDPVVPFQVSGYSVYALPNGELVPFNDDVKNWGDGKQTKRKTHTFFSELDKITNGEFFVKERAHKRRNTSRAILLEALDHSNYVEQPMKKQSKKTVADLSEEQIESYLVPRPFEDREEDNKIPKMPFGDAIGQHPFRSIFSDRKSVV